MAGTTFYDILEVPRGASAAQIKGSFRRLAMFYHPDKVKHLGDQAQVQAERRMKEISEAFSILRDDDKRALYDRCLDQGLDYTVEYSRAQSETPKDRAERAAQDQTRQYMLQAAARIVKDNVTTLLPETRWDVDEGTGSYDYVLRTRAGGDACTVHLKALDEVDLSVLGQHRDFLAGLGATTNSILVRDHLSVVLVTEKLKDAIALREETKRFNQGLLNVRRGEPRRALVLIKIASPTPFVPYGDNIRPPFGNLDLKLM